MVSKFILNKMKMDNRRILKDKENKRFIEIGVETGGGNDLSFIKKIDYGLKE